MTMSRAVTAGPLRVNRFSRITIGTVFFGQEWATLQHVRVPQRLLADFARSLATLYNAGVPLARAVELLSHQPESLDFSLIISSIHRDLMNGRSLEGAFAAYPKVFDETWMALVRRALEDGSLGETLGTLAEMYTRREHLRSRIRASCTYPLIVFGFSVLVALTAFNLLLPQILGLIAGSDSHIPVLTQLLIFVFNTGTHPLLLAELPLLVWLNVHAFHRMMTSEHGRLRLDRLKCRLPVFGPIFRKVAVAQLMHSLHVTLSRGVRVTLALELAAAACGNRVYRLHITRCVQGLRDGERLSSQFVASGSLFDPMVIQSLRLGEECGHLDRMFGSLAEYYDLEVSAALGNLLTLLEPFLIIATGLLVAFVVLAVFLPLYGMVGHG